MIQPLFLALHQGHVSLIDMYVEWLQNLQNFFYFFKFYFLFFQNFVTPSYWFSYLWRKLLPASVEEKYTLKQEKIFDSMRKRQQKTDYESQIVDGTGNTNKKHCCALNTTSTMWIIRWRIKPDPSSGRTSQCEDENSTCPGPVLVHHLRCRVNQLLHNWCHDLPWRGCVSTSAYRVNQWWVSHVERQLRNCKVINQVMIIMWSFCSCDDGVPTDDCDLSPVSRKIMLNINNVATLL